MKKGFELLIKSQDYSNKVITDFENVLGDLPSSYKRFINEYRIGYPCINIIEDSEVYAQLEDSNDKYIIEAFYTLPEVMDKLFSLDRAYGLSANHRKFKLIPICSSGSGYREYYLKTDSGEIFFLNPNEDIDIELEEQDLFEKHKITDSLERFIMLFQYNDLI